MFGVDFEYVIPVQCIGLNEYKTAAPVYFDRVLAPGFDFVFVAVNNKEDAGLMHLKVAYKVFVASADDVERARFHDNQHINFVYLAIADLDAGKNRAPELVQGSQLDGGLVFSKRFLLEQAQTQINGGGIQCVDHVLEIEAQVLDQIKISSTSDQNFQRSSAKFLGRATSWHRQK